MTTFCTRFRFILCMVAVFASERNSCRAEEGQTKAEIPLDVAVLVGERDRKFSEEIARMRDTYLAGLEKYRADWAGANQLDDALAALELKNQLEQTSTLKLSPEKMNSLRVELRRVAEAWSAAEAGHLRAANEALRKGLEKLRVEGIKNGNLAVVEASSREIALLDKAAGAGGATTDSAPKEDELPVVWDWASGGTLELRPNGEAFHSRWGGEKGSWERVTSRRLRLKHPNGTVMDISLRRDGSGEVVSRDGGSTIIRPRPKDSAPN